MPVRDALVQAAKAMHADIEELPDGRLALVLVLARRQAGTLLKRLRYRIVLDADPAASTVFFEEWLWEDDSPTGVDVAGSFGEKEQAYRVSGAEAPGNVEQVGALFEGRYGVRFDFPQVRLRLRDACESEGYQLRHLIPL